VYGSVRSLQWRVVRSVHGPVDADDAAQRVHGVALLVLRQQQRLPRVVDLELRAQHIGTRAGADLHAALGGFQHLLGTAEPRLADRIRSSARRTSK
jgi:hypothetical protein